MEVKELAQQVIEAVKGYVSRASDDLWTRIEKHLAEIPSGPKGDKGDPGESIKGEQGDKGDPGTPGERGQDGRDGRSIHSGEGPPLFGGNKDDTYLDTRSGDVYRFE